MCKVLGRIPRAQREQRLQTVLPPLFVVVVVVVELLIARLSSERLEFWAHLLFYGFAGPSVTYFVLDWIADGTQARMRAEEELRGLYEELQQSHGQLQSMQALMRGLTEAPDLDALLEVAARGAARVSGAARSEVSFGGLEASSGPAAGQLAGLARAAGESESWHVLSAALPEQGRLRLWWRHRPTAEDRALLRSLAAEIGTAGQAALQRTQDLLTLYLVDDSIRAERNMRRLLARVTGAMAGRTGAEFRAVYLSDPEGRLRQEYAESSPVGPAWSPVQGSLAPSFVARVAQAVQPLRATAAEAAEFGQSRSVVGFPMRDDAGLVGVLVLAHTQAGALAEANMPLLALMASQAALGIRNARAYLYSEELAIGEERTRIAREIHDGVAQSLAFLALKLDVVARQIHTDPDQAAAEVKAASALLREQIQEVRRSIFALRPINLEQYGLLDTLRMYVQDFGEQSKLRTSLSITGDVQLSAGDEAILFRILQESLNNVAKHAAAQSVSVSLSAESGWVELRVKDDGRGFDPGQISGRVSSAGGLGLTQMRERMESRGGRYRVESQQGSGTQVVAALPQGDTELRASAANPRGGTTRRGQGHP